MPGAGLIRWLSPRTEDAANGFIPFLSQLFLDFMLFSLSLFSCLKCYLEVPEGSCLHILCFLFLWSTVLVSTLKLCV